MTKIIVVYFDGKGDEEQGFSAYPEGRKDLITVGGITSDEAIGTLIRSYPEMFQVQVEEDPSVSSDDGKSSTCPFCGGHVWM